MANWWDAAPKASPLDVALSAEQVDPKIAELARSVYKQESDSGANTKTSNAGAVGGMQILKPTFDSVADKGWDINDPVENARAGVRYLAQLYKQAGGDPTLTAAGYYGGPGGLEKARRGVAVSDPRNPKAPTTLEYGKQVAARLANAVVPSANAAETPAGDWWASAPVVEPGAPAAAAPSVEKPGIIETLGATAGKGFGNAVLGAQQLVGKGLQQFDATRGAGDWLVNDATQGAKNLEAQAKPYADAHPVAGTVGEIGGAVANPLNRLIPLAGAGSLAGTALRAGAQGAISGAVTPVTEDYGDFGRNKLAQIATGAAIGGAIPVAGAGAKAVGRGIARAVTPTAASPEVGALAQRAGELGINLRADQVANSKPLNVLSAALDYLPFSGKGAAMSSQQKQFNTAVSRTLGENTDNVAAAIGNAEKRLGGEFDRVLKNTAVNADNAFQDDLARIVGDAQNEMTEQQFGVVTKQIDNILNKIRAGDVIDADAAYNIKKGLDRLGNSNDSTLAYYAREIRGSLLDALNRSLPDGGEAFAKTRQQWANLRELNKIIPRGAEGDISPARLANARNIRSQDLSELADIAGQFLKQRVGDSGTAQRMGVYSLLGSGAAIDPVSVGLGLTAGRAANGALSSNRLVQALIDKSINPATLNGNGALPAPVQNALVNRLAPYLVPAGATAGANALNKP